MERSRPVLFVRKGCDKCGRVLSFLEARAVAYDPVDIEDDPAAAQELQRVSGQSKTPTLVHDGKAVNDVDIPEVTAFLNKYQLDPRPGGK